MSDPPPAKRARPNDKTVHLTAAETRVVSIQFEKDSSFPRFNALLQEYCRFLQIKISQPETEFAPSYLIDKLWHAHILSTREYLAFCERHNGGEYLHHDPSMKRGQDRYKLTLEAYQKLCGNNERDTEIWPKHVDAKPGGESVNREEGGVTEEHHQDNQENEDSDENDSDEYDSGEYDSDERDYLRDFGDERGKTREELAEWHKEAILDPQNNEGFDPREHLDTGNCGYVHRWFDGEFDLSCDSCRDSSRSLGQFSCG